jgi:beta-lactamase class A
MSSRALTRDPAPPSRAADSLRSRIDELADEAGAAAIGVAVHDLATGFAFRYRADRWFHAASTIKLAVLVGVYRAVHRGVLVPQSRLHVRNLFRSAVDGTPFRVSAGRDANAEVQRAIGKTMRISELAHHMIATSSNLATNLLLDYVGLDETQRALEELAVDGIDLRRGVEDERAFEAGISNRVTADGLVALLRAIAEERAFSGELSRDMLGILHAQEFRSGIPAHLPDVARIAHKTGDISTVAHDAGIVYLPDRPPYVVAILTEWSPERGGRSRTIASVSRAVYEALTCDAERRDG